MFTGCGTALVTPFRQDQSLDEEALRRLVRRQIDAGINFLVPCGTTGESPTLSHAEQRRVVEILVEEARGQTCLCSRGRADTTPREVIERAREFKSLGADGILSVSSVLQQALARGPLSALQSDRRGGCAARSFSTICRAARACNIEPATVDTPRGDRQHRRRQGSVRQHFGQMAAIARASAGAIPRAFRR